MKKHLLTTAFTLFSFSFIWAQELQSISYTTNSINESEIELSDNWRTVIEDNNVLIYNGNIKNESKKNVRNIRVNLFLTPQVANPKAGVVQGYSIAEVPFKSVAKNSSLVGVNIRGEVQDMPPVGLYDPVLVLTDREGNVLDIHRVNVTIRSEENSLAILAIDPMPSSEMADPNLNPVVKMTIEEDNSVAFEKEWKVEVDFKNFLVKVMGGDVSNKTNKDMENVILDVFLTKQDQSLITSNFEAVHIASAQLSDKIESYKKFVDASLTTNMSRIPEKGTYYILLTLSVKNDEGESVVKSKRAFSNTVSF